MINFTFVSEIDFLPVKAKKFLNQACKRTPSPVFSADDIIFKIRNGIGDLYLIENNGEVLGIVYLIILQGEYQKIVNIVGLSGEKIHLWKDDFRLFINRIIQENHADCGLAITRFGMKKIFPEWKPKAELLEYKIVH